MGQLAKAPGGMGRLWLCQTRWLLCLDQWLSHQPVQASVVVSQLSSRQFPLQVPSAQADLGEEAAGILPLGARRFLTTCTNCSSSEAPSVLE